MAAGAAKAAALMLEAAPDLSAPFAEFAAFYGGASGSHSQPRAGSRTGSTVHGHAGPRPPPRSDASMQTEEPLPEPLSEEHWRQRARELQRANARLQTALLAAALDTKEGAEADLRMALSAINRSGNVGGAVGNVASGGPPRVKGTRQARSGSASARRPTDPPAAGARLPRTLYEWPPMA